MRSIQARSGFHQAIPNEKYGPEKKNGFRRFKGFSPLL